MNKNLLPILIVAVTFVLGGAYAGYRQHAAKPSAEPVAAAKPLPSGLFEQVLPDAAGIPHPLSQWKGKPLIVNFWATWCAPCVKEMPELSALQAELAPKGVQIVGIGVDTPENIQNFAAKYQISYPLYVAGASGVELSRQLGNKNGGLPFTVLFDKDGAVIRTYLGPVESADLRADVARL